MKKKIVLILTMNLLTFEIFAQDLASIPVTDIKGLAQQSAMVANLLKNIDAQMKTYQALADEGERSIKRMTQFPSGIINTAVNYYKEQKKQIEDIKNSFEELQMQITGIFESPEDFFITNNDYNDWFNPELSEEERKILIEKDLERVKIMRLSLENQALDFKIFSEQSKERLRKGYNDMADAMNGLVGNKSMQQALTTMVKSQGILVSLFGDALLSLNMIGQNIADKNQMEMVGKINSIASLEMQIAHMPDDHIWGIDGPEPMAYPEEETKRLKEALMKPIHEQELYKKDQQILKNVKRKNPKE